MWGCMQQSMDGGLGVDVTPLTRNTLIALFGLYVTQLIADTWLGLPVTQWLALHPIGSGWMPWQPLTSLLLNGSPLGAMLDWLVLFFFMGTTERLLGTRRFIQAVGASVGVAAVATTFFDAVGILAPAPGSVFLGLEPVMLALLVLFGLTIPNARIMLFFVLPIRASWVAWASGLLSLLTFLATRELSASMALGGWLGGYLWLRAGPDALDRWRRRNKARQVERDLQRFTVLPGGRSKEKDDGGPWVH